MIVSLASSAGELEVSCAVMEAERHIPCLNQIKNIIISSLKIEALLVGVASVESDDGGEKKQTIQDNWV